MQTNIIKMMKIADVASLLNAIMGISAIIMAHYQNTTLTAMLLILAVIFDAIDGPLARHFPNDTKEIFGETIDSLADVISFGVAPAIIIFELYKNPVMLIASVLILSCGILRLSRYNTIITEQTGPTKTFIGVPIPVTSFMLALLLLSHINNEYITFIIMIIIALLMVSSYTYPKIKNRLIFIVCGILMIPTLIYPINDSLMNIPSLILILLVIGYLILPFTSIKI